MSCGAMSMSCQPRVAQYLPDLIRIGEREWPRRVSRQGRRRRDVLERGRPRHAPPRVRSQRLPARERDPAVGAQRAAQVCERRHRIREEHDPETRDHRVERHGLERIYLRVGLRELDVAKAGACGIGTRALEHRRRQVGSEHGTGRDPRAAASVVAPQPQPMSRTRSPAFSPAASRIIGVNGASIASCSACRATQSATAALLFQRSAS